MITFIVNGVDYPVECSDSDTLLLLVNIALTSSRDDRRRHWQVRDQHGVLLPMNRTVGELRIDSSRLYLMPNVGAGGMT